MSSLKLSGLVFAVAVAAYPAGSKAQTLYDFGNPTADEQYYYELINRARANPPAEGARLAATTDPAVLGAYSQYGVDLAMMQTEFNAIAAAPPLVPNAKLLGIARSHSSWMLANAVQSHDEGAVGPFQRMTNAGYSYSSAAENVYAYSKSLWFGHAGFQVDWGSGGTGGMLAGRGHRTNIHNASFREVGIGMAYGTNGSVGPQLVTQDFGTQSSSPNFGTGVVYYDMNSNNFYDSGEGISGLTVNVSGATYYCTTASGGGWTMPIPTTATTRTVTFTGLGINQTASLVVPASKNAKADLKLTYSAPAITSPATASTGSTHTLQFNAVGGAASYKWNRWSTAAAPAENCESTAGITSSTTGTYAVRSTSVFQQGTSSFHLALGTPTNQSFELNTLYYGNPSASISFQSRVRAAFSSERFKVQVKEEGGTWVDAYDQAGSGGTGESSFTLRSAALTAIVGKAFRVRFLHQYASGSYYGATDSAGWFVDAIAFANVSALSNNTLTTLATNTGSFTPSTTGSLLMSVTPVISGLDFPAAYQILTVTNIPPSITSHPASSTIDSGNTVTLNVSATGTAPFTYQWYQGASGTTTTPVGGNSSSFTSPALTGGTSYWVRVSNSAGSANSNTATITVNIPAVTVAVAPGSVAEDGAANLVYTFTRTGSTTSSLTVNFSVGGSAALTSDYTQSGAATFGASAGTVTIAAGASSKTITLDPVADTTVEPDETAFLTATAGSGYAVGVPSAATGTINNDDIAPPVITSQPASTTIVAGSTATLSVAATGTTPSYQWLSVADNGSTTPVGTNAPVFSTPSLTTPARYKVRVSNTAAAVDSATAIVAVRPTFASWSAQIEAASNLPAGTLANNPNGDWDRDGRANLIEFAFGASPVIPNDSAPGMPSVRRSATHVILDYKLDTSLAGITVAPVAAVDLANWKAPGESGAPAGFSDVLISTSGSTQTREAKVPLLGAPRVFMRMRVDAP